MKQLNTSVGVFGPFASTSRNKENNGWLCDDCIYQDNVIGAATSSEYITPPPQPPTISELNAPILAKIAALETTQTSRLVREVALGDAFSISKLKKIDDDIKVLRAQLK